MRKETRSKISSTLRRSNEEFKSLKNIFVNRKQFIHLAKINSPAYKIREKEKEREKAKTSKSVLFFGNF